MSTIGRIFVVLNLLLSGGFLYFAGVQLTNQTNYSTQLEEERADRKTQVDALETSLESRSEEVFVRTNEATAAQNQLEAASRELASVKEERDRLVAQQADMQGKLTEIAGNWSQITSQLRSVEKQLADTRELARTAEQERNQAVAAQTTAVADFADAQQRISNMESDMAALQQTYEGSLRTLQERDLLVEALRVKLAQAGIDASVSALLPALEGTVIRVEPTGNYLTLRVQEGDQPVQVGYTFSISAGGRLKAVATVTEVYQNGAAFCTYRTVSGSAGPEVGDEAFTKR